MIGEDSNEQLTDRLTLDSVQRASFEYFLREVNPANGLVADTSRAGSPASIAVCGFAMSCYPIAVERGWVSRGDAVAYALALLRFMRDSDQSGSPDSTGFKGFYFHFLDVQTGQREWKSELSLIDSALLIAGVLTAAAYFANDTSAEREICELAGTLYDRMDWRWAQNGGVTITHGWKPESGFLNYGWEGYSEAILLYVLAAGSTTFPVHGDCYSAWTRTYQWENIYGHDVLYAGPLFVHQFSHAWIDFRGIRDRFMRQKKSDYFENSRRTVLVHKEYASRNPGEFEGYDENTWGLTACDGPHEDLRDLPRHRQRLFGYAARGVPYGPDDGSMGGWSALASLPFAPEEALRAARAMAGRYPEILTDNMYTSSFNPDLSDEFGKSWVSPGHFGLDQGIVIMMIENYRTEFVWKLVSECISIRRGLKATGFKGGWL